MDPLSAVGLGANILQFIEFSSKLISTAREVAESPTGTTVDCADLEDVAHHIVRLNKMIPMIPMDPMDPMIPISINKRPYPEDNSSERTIIEISWSCHGLATELIGCLNKLRVDNKHGKWESILQAIHTIWTRPKIDNLRQRLEEHHTTLQTALILSLRSQVYSISKETARTRLSGTTLDHLKIDLLQAIKEHSTDDKNPLQHYALFSSILEKMTREECDLYLRTQILEKLAFQDHTDRESRIPTAHKKTFNWVFTNDHRDDHRHDHEGKRWSNFVSWLRANDDSLYWVTGKPGSGKSTLMKFIVHNPVCATHLATWAEGMPVITLRFYFWNSGSNIQYSQEGLFRSLLYEAIKQRPEIVSRLFPQRWSRSLLFGFDSKPWTISELTEAFEVLVQGAKDMYKLCMFIDGLDEFDGNRNNLISLFKNSASSPNVKICVSSRPWAVFQENFARQPSLMLEDLTYPDIYAYISTKFNENSGFNDLKMLEKDYDSALVKNIAAKSCGVFLWVHLVVDSLLGGLTNSDRISDLQRRLDELPADLEKYYAKMLNDIEPFYEKHAGQLFSLVAASEGKLTALGLSFAEEDETNNILLKADQISFLSPKEVEFRIKAVRRRLSSCCKGLIEIPSVSYASNSAPELDQHLVGPGSDIAEHSNVTPESLRLVSYLHRTAKDYLETEEAKLKTDRMTAGYIPYPALTKSAILIVKTLHPESQQGLVLGELVRQGLHYASAATTARVPIEPRIIDELYRYACAVSLRDSQYFSADGFLALAATFHLHTYVSEKIQCGVKIFDDQAEVSLLQRIVTEYQHYPSLCEPKLLEEGHHAPAIDIIQHISRDDLDPNHIVHGQSLWSMVLDKCIVVGKKRMEEGQDNSNELDHWASIVEIFIKMGADPRMNRDSVLGSRIQLAFGGLLPKRAKQLEKLLGASKRGRTIIRIRRVLTLWVTRMKIWGSGNRNGRNNILG